MKSFVANAAQLCIFLIAVLAALPADAGGMRSTAPGHKGHSVSHRGVASFYRNSRNLPNGVSIFGQRRHASSAPVKKGIKRKHLRKSHGNVKNISKSRHRTEKRKHARKGDRMRGMEKRSKRRHKAHKKRRPVRGTTVYIAAPPYETIYPQYSNEENCRHLIERGYDRAGRRVLVEWTLCFDEKGTAYVPAEGRRILARY